MYPQCTHWVSDPLPPVSSPGSGESATLANNPRVDPFITHLILIEDLHTPPSPVSETLFGDMEVEVLMEDRMTLEMRDQEVEAEVDALVAMAPEELLDD